MSRPLVSVHAVNYVGTSRRREYVSKNGKTGDYVAPTSYDRVHCEGSPPGVLPNGAKFYIDGPNTVSVQEFLSSGGIPSWSQPAANRAYERFRESALGDTSAVAAALGEWSQSTKMIGNRMAQLGHAARALRRKNFVYFLDVWKSSTPRGRRYDPSAKRAADLWLEGSFGWKPLMSDAYNACQQLSEDLPSTKYDGRATDNDTVKSNTGGSYRYEQWKRITHKTGGLVELQNPNLFLASQLGLVNPLSTAWELTPGSFVVDWMSDVGAFLGSMSDFIGTKISFPWRSSSMGYSDFMIANSNDNKTAMRGFCSRRRTALLKPLPNLEIRRNLGESITRAANATALAIQLWSRPKRMG